VKGLGLLAMAAACYVVAAWAVTPGFYDGFSPPQPYNWVCPPPQAGANQAPTTGHDVVKVIDGISEASSAFTDDGQVVMGFLPGSFDAKGATTVTVDITPVTTCPQPPGLRFVTNTYAITATAPLVMPATLVMRYSNLVVDPSYVYRAASLSGPWTNIGANSQAQLWTIDTKTDHLSYFAAGFPSNAVSSGARSANNQILPAVVAALIVAVLLAGVPLSIVRRRSAARRPAGRDEEDEEEA
jgi:hypothetical protein